MHRDLVCSLEPGNYLFILLCAENAWQNIKSDDLCNWVEKSYRWTNYHRCSLLVLNSGHDIDKQLSPLLREYRSLSGLASIRYQGITTCSISPGGGVKKASAPGSSSLFFRMKTAGGWRRMKKRWCNRAATKKSFLAICAYWKAPALSEYWTLFDTNDAVFNAGRMAQAATLIFSITQNEQIEQLGRYIHTLRRQRGSALKIVVREQTPSLRATDERLLLSSGANMVIPSGAPLSRCLTLIESVQKQQFTRHIPEDFNTLLTWSQPLKLRGYQKWGTSAKRCTILWPTPCCPPMAKA
jgi:hypothetical protein